MQRTAPHSAHSARHTGNSQDKSSRIVKGPTSRACAIRNVTGVQLDLLCATVLTGAPARGAWQRWRRVVDIDTLEPESFGLLGALYKNLELLGIEDSWMPRLKGIYRRNWCRNQMWIRRAIDVQAVLERHDVRCLFLRDVAVVLGLSLDLGVRPIHHLDVLIYGAGVGVAVDAMTAAGWRQCRQQRRYGDHAHSVAFDHSDHGGLTVHQHVFHAVPQDHVDGLVWAHAATVFHETQAVPVLDATNQFLAICRHCCRRDARHPLEAIADAYGIVRRSEAVFDWHRLVCQAQRYEAILPVKHVLTLFDALGCRAHPDWVLTALAKMPVSHYELRRHDVSGEAPLLQLKSAILRLLTTTG